MARLAWFSPMPPIATGIARCSADLVSSLAAAHEIEVYVDQRNLPGPEGSVGLRSAHDFIWRHRQRPYDLVVYQLGNSSHHDFQWPYLFRYPGLVVLHDAHLHHARAACLLRTSRADDYRAEFAWNHPRANPDLAELAVAGFDSHLHYAWPMTRAIAQASRMVLVHTAASAERLREEAPAARVETIHLGHGVDVPADRGAELSRETRTRLGIPSNAFVFGCFGGLSPDKRLPQVLAAFAATRASAPSAHLLLVGQAPDHYDLRSDIQRHGLDHCSTLTGYVESDESFTACIAACDATLNLRWPTAREVSGPWLRCLAAGKPTVTIDLAHTIDVPSLDPRTWLPNHLASRVSGGHSSPCTIAIDIVDEDHSLRIAMRRLAADADLRATLGASARRYWSANHSPDLMIADYRRIIAMMLENDVRAIRPEAPLPGHLTDVGAGTLTAVLQEFGLPAPLPL